MRVHSHIILFCKSPATGRARGHAASGEESGGETIRGVTSTVSILRWIPVTLIVVALAAGAATGLKDTAASAIKDAYGALKGLLSRRYGSVNIGDVERKPESEAKRASVAEDLAAAGAGDDEELLELARQLVEAVRENDPGSRASDWHQPGRRRGRFHSHRQN